ncbi:F-box protein (macronuclear) [Tetrahymena thermophila SB210]|uniref:F-box protein n=1 Tax=Tetrahymena thermophila (strain SB210) TaxID=312017 RepID=Q22TV0_TETTS|nr:F-box protein [Tetrahymena thermophila SB210]EAR88710.1 F-box protein [Tetrahymena thermophila SB210]|eukprot:XP_001008955.1 F-box protein [Tetrahymena thermophila SB210]
MKKVSNLKTKEETKIPESDKKKINLKQTSKPSASSKTINSTEGIVQKQSIKTLNATQQKQQKEKGTVEKANSSSKVPSSTKMETKQVDLQKPMKKAIEKKDNNNNNVNQTIKKSLPAYKLTKEVFKMVNKNVIQIILSFLNAKEAFKLAITSKSMNELTKQALQSTISYLEEKKKQIKLMNNLNDDQVNAVIYLKHFYIFKSKSGCYISSHYFNNPDLKALIYTLWQVVAEQKSEGAQYFNRDLKDEHYYFQVYHNLQNAKKEKLHIIEECLKIYTDEHIDNLHQQYSYMKTYIILFQKYLKGIKLYSEQNLNYQTLSNLEQAYFKFLFNIDQNIYFYKQMLKQNQETILIFSFDFSKGFRPKKINSFPSNLFS